MNRTPHATARRDRSARGRRPTVGEPTPSDGRDQPVHPERSAGRRAWARLREDGGAATAEYAVATMAAVDVLRHVRKHTC